MLVDFSLQMGLGQVGWWDDEQGRGGGVFFKLNCFSPPIYLQHKRCPCECLLERDKLCGHTSYKAKINITNTVRLFGNAMPYAVNAKEDVKRTIRNAGGGLLSLCMAVVV